jgi:predicted O-methyltransferase YrrM
VILTPAVEAYLEELLPASDPLLAEMEAHGRRDRIPIVNRETGVLLGVLARSVQARRIVEIGTAIGVSTLHLARALPADGELVSFEVDAVRHAAAQGYLERAGLGDRVDLRLQPGLEGLAELSGPFDLAFLDAVKLEYGDYLSAVLPLLRSGGLVVVDNLLMGGAVAEGRAGEDGWSQASIDHARAVNRRLVAGEGLTGTLLPVGDGVGVAVKA